MIRPRSQPNNVTDITMLAGAAAAEGRVRAARSHPEKLLASALSDDTSFGPVEAVSKSLTVCAQVRTNDENEQPQLDSVLVAIGQGGADFASRLRNQSSVTRFGSKSSLRRCRPLAWVTFL
jgi:hypothetical protein